jgi:hypothetical protein
MILGDLAELGFDVDPSATLLDNDVIIHREGALSPLNIFSLLWRDADAVDAFEFQTTLP